MRLQATINDRVLCTASLPGEGTLWAQVVMTEQSDGRAEPCELRVEGSPGKTAEPTTLRWPATHLTVGDEVHLRLLPEGPSQAPVEQVAGSIAPPALPLQSAQHSAQLVALCNRFSAELFDWLDRTLSTEPPSHAVPLKKAVSCVAFALSERLLYPAYLQRPELVPADLQTDL